MTKKALSKKFEKQIKQALAGIKRYNPEKIILYGSLARGDFDKNSDIDILVIKKNIKKNRMIERMRQLNKYLKFGLPVETVIFTPEEIRNRLRQNDFFLADALREGKTLYEKK